MIDIDGKTKLFGVLADPIDHVKATQIYNERWLIKKKKFLMVPIHVKPKNLYLILKKKILQNFSHLIKDLYSSHKLSLIHI